jgi:hypothetical protein
MKKTGHARACLAAGALILIQPLAGVARAAPTPALPADQRLAGVRPALQRTLDQARSDGLPAELIVSKVREGLAKGAPPEAIRLAATRLEENLRGAQTFLKAQRPTAPSPALIRVVAEGRGAGVEPEATAPIVASKAPDAVLVPAVEALTDLALRGYPARRAGLLIKEVADREPSALARVVAGVEEIRNEQTVSRAEALDLLAHNVVSAGTSFDAALTRALEPGDRAGSSVSSDGPGKSSQAPGHLNGAGAGKGKKPAK